MERRTLTDLLMESVEWHFYDIDIKGIPDYLESYNGIPHATGFGATITAPAIWVMREFEEVEKKRIEQAELFIRGTFPLMSEEYGIKMLDEWVLRICSIADEYEVILHDTIALKYELVKK